MIPADTAAKLRSLIRTMTEESTDLLVMSDATNHNAQIAARHIGEWAMYLEPIAEALAHQVCQREADAQAIEECLAVPKHWRDILAAALRAQGAP